MTSTPKQTNLTPFDKKAFRQYGALSVDSYTKGTYRPLVSPPSGDSGYSDSSDRIISPHDWNKKRYGDRAGDSTLSLTESVTDRNGRKEATSDSPVRSTVSTQRGTKQTHSPYGSKPVSTEPPVTQHAPLLGVRSHPYKDILASPGGPTRKLDSHTSSYSSGPISSRITLLEKQRETHRQTKLSDSPTKKTESERKELISNNQTESRWKRGEHKLESETKNKENISKVILTTQSQTQDNKPTIQDARPRESRSFQESRNARKQRLDAGQIMTAVISSQTGDTETGDKLDTVPIDKPKEEPQPSADPYVKYRMQKQNQPKRQPLKQESVAERKEAPAPDPQVSLKKRCIALALSSEKSVSIDEKKPEVRGVTIPDLKPSPFEKQFDPPGSPSRLPAVRQEAEAPADKSPPPTPSQAERLAFAEFGCDLAPSDSDSEIYIAPFSPDLKWAPVPLQPAPSVRPAPQGTDTEPRKTESSSEKVNNNTCLPLIVYKLFLESPPSSKPDSARPNTGSLSPLLPHRGGPTRQRAGRAAEEL